MKKVITRNATQLPVDIEYFRLEPFIDLSTNLIIGYEVLSKLRDGLNPEYWFTDLSSHQQIDILFEQLRIVSAKVKSPCFYNLTVKGFMLLEQCDIEYISTFTNACLEISDASKLMSLNEKKLYTFFKNVESLRIMGVKIWVDDFCIDDVITLPVYKDCIDGIKIDKSEIQANHLKYMIKSANDILGNIPILIEGIESKSTLDIARESGAGFAQGYYWEQNIEIKI
ncbi:TPA: EAL domain-containing protein [Enterobacter ludwigii]|nr:EAL domain-containing protein [Enterobacter ludwigii]